LTKINHIPLNFMSLLMLIGMELKYLENDAEYQL